MARSLSLPDMPSIHGRWIRACSTGDSRATVAMRNLRMRRVLERVACAFNQAGIPLMVMKGAALNPTVYESGERPMDDLDLLVRPEHLPDASRILTDVGAKPGRPLLRDDFCPRFYYEKEFLIGTVDPVKIDVHVRPFRPLPCAKHLPEDALWEGARAISIGSATALIPNAERMLIHLAVHAAFHGFSRLKWLDDIYRWTSTYGAALDWRALLDMLRAWRLMLPFRAAILAAEGEFGPFCPHGITRQLNAHAATWVERLILWQAPRDAQHPLAHVLVNLLCTPGFRFKMGYIHALLLPEASHFAAERCARCRERRLSLTQARLRRWLKPFTTSMLALRRGLLGVAGRISDVPI